jgi:oligopeptide/dipeptide ABC transporter ATP-binding protein
MLRIDDLTVRYFRGRSNFTVLKNLDLHIKSGSIFGLVGESGAGKTTLVNSIMQILPANSRQSGTVVFNNDVLNKESIRKIRGKEISFISQNFHQSLSNSFRIKNQFDFLLRSNLSLTKQERIQEMMHALESLNFHNPKEILNKYPFELSGGMLQRVVIAMATTCRPKLIIADEPTSAVDVIVISRLLRYLSKLKTEKNIAVLLISHDLSLIKGFCDDIAVMLGGHIIEQNSQSIIFNKPLHPYTKLLLTSKPKSKINILEEKTLLRESAGSPCPYYNYCALATDICAKKLSCHHKDSHYVKCNNLHLP